MHIRAVVFSQSFQDKETKWKKDHFKTIFQVQMETHLHLVHC